MQRETHRREIFMARIMVCLVMASVLGVLMMVNHPPAGAEESSVVWLAIFKAYPGAKEHCSQHISGRGMNIHWTMYVSTDPPDKVAAFYEIEVSGKRDGGEDRTLSVHDAKKGGFPTCDVPLDEKTQSVMIVAKALRR